MVIFILIIDFCKKTKKEVPLKKNYHVREKGKKTTTSETYLLESILYIVENKGFTMHIILGYIILFLF